MNADNTFIVTETDGKKIRDQDDRISVVMLKGNGKGHVYIKGLQQVIFKSVE